MSLFKKDYIEIAKIFSKHLTYKENKGFIDDFIEYLKRDNTNFKKEIFLNAIGYKE
jgi:hypothetical protein